MTTTKTRRTEGAKTGRKAAKEPPWGVVLHNDWDNSMPRVGLILKRA